MLEATVDNLYSLGWTEDMIDECVADGMSIQEMLDRAIKEYESWKQGA